MFDLLIFLKVSGPNVKEENVYDTLKSIRDNIGINNYGICITISKKFQNMVSKILNTLVLNDKVVEIKEKEVSWAKAYNSFFDMYKDKAKWIMTTHDDVDYRTKDFFAKTLELVNGKEDEIGFISYNADTYYRDIGIPVQDGVRPGFYQDRDNWPCMFECHNFDKKKHRYNTKSNLDLLDMPKEKSLVKVHATMSNVMIATSESRKKIGPCVDWTQYTMLIDEDWGLEALKNNLWNIWIPDIYVTHPLRFKERPTGNKWVDEAHTAFINKWGFSYPFTDRAVQFVQEKYKDTLIPWSSYRNSYNWEYLE